MPLTREDIWLWLKTYDGQLRDTKKLRGFLQGKIDAAGVKDQYVDTKNRTDISGDQAHLVDLILADMESYK